MKPFPIPVSALGLGSQTDEEILSYMSMPSGMSTYQNPLLPEPEQVRDLAGAREVLERALSALKSYAAGDPTVCVDLSGLDPENMSLVNQLLGEGEVSASVETATQTVRIQESVFAGVWRVRDFDRTGRALADQIEVGSIPAAVRAAGLSGSTELRVPAKAEPGVVNAPALLAEIAEQMAKGDAVYVINLTLLPFTPEDGAHMDRVLGRGQATILSRGYGNCRITATSMARVWWVQFFNSTDITILNTIEVTDMPEVAVAALEDINDSAERLAEVLDWIG